MCYIKLASSYPLVAWFLLFISLFLKIFFFKISGPVGHTLGITKFISEVFEIYIYIYILIYISHTHIILVLPPYVACTYYGYQLDFNHLSLKPSKPSLPINIGICDIFRCGKFHVKNT